MAQNHFDSPNEVVSGIILVKSWRKLILGQVAVNLNFDPYHFDW